MRRKPGGIPVQRKTVKRDESAQKIHPRPTRDSVSRRASVGAARVRGTRIFYVRCTSARMTRGITAKFAPKSAPIRAPGQVFSKSFTPIPLLKQRNSFSDFENTTLFAHRRRNAEDSSTPDARFRQRRRIRRRGEGTRIIYVRGTSARGITAESVPKSAQIYALREIFLKISKKFRFRCNEKAKNIVYIIYGIITGNICTPKGAAGARLSASAQNFTVNPNRRARR